MRLPAIALAAAVMASACAPTPGTERVSMGRTADIASAATQISVQRAGAGILLPIVQDPLLQGAAQSHADDLVRTGTFSHRGSDGSSVADRVERAGYIACVAAENIAQGQPDVRSAIAAWMASDGHRRNLLNAQVTEFGFARASDIWVLVLARPC